MTESKIAPWMTAIATLVGVITLMFAFREHYTKERADEIARWQRVLVYKIIADSGGAKFRDLKQQYIAAAQQLQSFKLPSKEIQDDAMRYILLDLQRDKVIYLGVANTYKPYIEAVNTGMEFFETKAKEDYMRQETFRVARPAIMKWIEKDPGKYSSD